MSVDVLATKIKKMVITEKNAPILEKEIMQDIFKNNIDIYSNSSDDKMRKAILNVPNIYCGLYFDDEDFIYSRIKFANELSISPTSITSMHNIYNLNYLEYIKTNNINIYEIDLNPSVIITKILYINQYTNAYYTSLRHLRPINRLKHIPDDFIIWIHNINDTIHLLLDKKLLNYQDNPFTPLEMFNELIYGLNLITCHIRLISNHFKFIDKIKLTDMDYKYFII